MLDTHKQIKKKWPEVRREWEQKEEMMFAQGFAVPARSFFFGSHFLHIIYKSLRLRLVSHHADSGIYLSSMSQPESMCLQSREYSRGPGICVGVIC
jgi:hypothetical protein